MTKTSNVQDIFSDMAVSGKWESSYGKSKYSSYNFITRMDSVAALLKSDKFKMTLDLGCGTGDYAPMLKAKTPAYIGVDFIPAMASRAHQRFSNKDQGVNFLAAEGGRLPFQSQCFDLVVAIGFIEYFEEPEKVIEEIARVMATKGTLVIQSYKRDFFWACAHYSGFESCRRFLARLYHKLKGSKKEFFSVDRPFNKHELDAMLKKYGFNVVDYRFDNYFVVPRFIAQFFPGVYIRISNSINKKSKAFNAFAVNYVARYVLDM